MLEKWRSRHQTPFNLSLHAVGVPLTVLGIALLLRGKFFWAALSFVAGYALQFIGHAREGSEVGELLWIKNLLKK